MTLLNELYKSVTKKIGYNPNSRVYIDVTKSLKEILDDVVLFIESGNKCSDMHACIYLMKILRGRFIASQLILTGEGENRRASLLVNDGFKWIVMNPIEDIEFFEDKKIPSEIREKFYNVDGSFRGQKQGVCTKDASNILLEDFMERYGNGRVINLGTFYREDNDKITLLDLQNDAKEIDFNDYKENNRFH